VFSILNPIPSRLRRLMRARTAKPGLEPLEVRSLMSGLTTGMFVPAVSTRHSMPVSSFSFANVGRSGPSAPQQTPNAPELTFTTTAGAWSPDFGRMSYGGIAIPVATLFVERNRGERYVSRPLLSWQLSDVRVVADRYSANPHGGLPLETVVLNCVSVTETFNGSRHPELPSISGGHSYSDSYTSQFTYNAATGTLTRA
jgi:hypothetical protein